MRLFSESIPNDIFGVDKQDLEFDAKLTTAYCGISFRFNPDKRPTRNVTKNFLKPFTKFSVIRMLVHCLKMEEELMKN